MIYGLTQTLVTLPGNAGFGVASNIAARLARSDRLLFLNPDVFPCDPGWARRHLDVLANLPPEQTRLFGSSLYYADGSLMHGCMYFEVDACFHPTPEGMTRRSMVRVENYGKGAPPWASQYVASRAVPAVSQAFLSIDRAWFEKLGRFTEHYIFDHSSIITRTLICALKACGRVSRPGCTTSACGTSRARGRGGRRSTKADPW
ncbi:MAG TPA: hypothetical protein VFE41_23250 [Acetobacteraceae bacterium]|nr:hypothetical protein [Acetobacteraceae bacterium]